MWKRALKSDVYIDLNQGTLAEEESNLLEPTTFIGL
jgi:hypothetical protein